MDKMPILAVIFQGIPESIVVYCFGMAIVGEYINFKRILIASIITPFLMMFVRSVVPVFGIHIIIGIFILFILFWSLMKLDIKKAIISSILSMSILTLLEILIYSTLFKLVDTSYAQAYNNLFQRILLPYVVIISYTIITFLIYHFKLPLIKGKRINNEQEIFN
jgi:hypothetical protein